MSLTDAKPGLEQEILRIFEAEANETENPEASRQRVARKLANAIDTFVRSGLVTVATTGTATAQTGTGTIT